MIKNKDLEIRLLSIGKNHFTYEGEEVVRALHAGRTIQPHPHIPVTQSNRWFHPDIQGTYHSQVTPREAHTVFGSCALVLAEGTQGPFIYFDRTKDETAYASLIGKEQKTHLAIVATSPSILDSKEQLATFLEKDKPSFDTPHWQNAILEPVLTEEEGQSALYIVKNPLTNTAMELFLTTTKKIEKGLFVYNHHFYVGEISTKD